MAKARMAVGTLCILVGDPVHHVAPSHFFGKMDPVEQERYGFHMDFPMVPDSFLKKMSPFHGNLRVPPFSTLVVRDFYNHCPLIRPH